MLSGVQCRGDGGLPLPVAGHEEAPLELATSPSVCT